jgi:hypothetical protein
LFRPHVSGRGHRVDNSSLLIGPGVYYLGHFEASAIPEVAIDNFDDDNFISLD